MPFTTTFFPGRTFDTIEDFQEAKREQARLKEKLQIAEGTAIIVGHHKPSQNH